LVALGYAEVDHAGYGALRLTAAARPILRGEHRVEMRRNIEAKPVKASRGRFARAASGLAPDPNLLARLKEWRREEARRQAVPAYVILHDATLAEIAQRVPRDVPSLGEIPGIGQKRLERYGAALIGIVQAECANPR
jgi:ATP-dependent DNA helicase RecQ